ncbi:hypothetical protein DBR40_07360 [Pedobacter sp. KBW01]|uniref:DUF4276 family protein n=1 Tax=Pedobacter sp. KBW01 TaxID=2153364 RepID=UPI000F5986EF|nr:DUF4276 family protein [Pedobacter sp. KBW01]RQO77785.1 hypothetical protein DBR40_07360 [Pedobacter sp. KBW01]
MKRIIIICEGPTELEFCKDVLQPHFNAKAIYLQTPKIKKSHGGIVKWPALVNEITAHLKGDSAAYVTTLVDYYGMQKKHLFPGWEDSLVIADKNQRMDFLENAMKADIDELLRSRYIPYIQLHEFEALLFNNITSFEENIPENEFTDKDELEQILKLFPNPELINETPENAPSYRLKKLIKGYDKIVYGSIIAESIGLVKIRQKCPRFHKWITELEKNPLI